MGQVHQNIRGKAETVQMAEEVREDVNGAPDAENPEVNTGKLGRDQRRDQREGSGTEVAEIDQPAHVKKPEHEPVLVHDSGNVVQRVDAQKPNREPKRAFLDDADLSRHDRGRW